MISQIAVQLSKLHVSAASVIDSTEYNMISI
jgi:hypothetical protein